MPNKPRQAEAKGYEDKEVVNRERVFDDIAGKPGMALLAMPEGSCFTSFPACCKAGAGPPFSPCHCSLCQRHESAEEHGTNQANQQDLTLMT